MVVDAGAVSPQVTWGTNPGMVVGVAEAVPDPARFETPAERDAAQRALNYMGLEAGMPIQEVRLDRVFIGSCTNSRIGDLRAAAAVVKGRKVATSVHAMSCPARSRLARRRRPRALIRSSAKLGSTGVQPAARCASG